jgi:4-diphosphocytidyl-2-C-methyl-D-erythritol kinase
MSGIGEQLAPMPGLADQPVLLVNPGVPVATADVFDALGFRHGDKGFDPILDAGDLARMRNDLTAPACRVCPAIAEVLNAIGSVENVRYARMSGSGATCFGIFASTDEARRAAGAIQADHPAWWCAVTTLA